MIIELASVGVLPKALKESFTPDDVELDGEGELVSVATLDADVFSKDEKVYIRGRIGTIIRLECTRCLENVTTPADLDFEAIFVDASKEDSESEVEVKDAALDESLVLDGRIDLREVVREQLLLSLPEQVYCSDDCKGLCPKCGTNRNLLDCKCDEGDIDPRWAALKNLR